MWNRLEPFLLRLLDIWNYLALFFLRLLGRHDSSPRSENEVDDNIDLYSQMMDEKADSEPTNGGDDNNIDLHSQMMDEKADPGTTNGGDDDNIDLYSQMMDEKADSGTTDGGDYDVFLSFRGPDTRHGFADCLYEFLCLAGIRVYRDREELQPGEKIPEILGAVKSSQIFIAIFSNGYASSKWCLEELLCMLESIRRSPGKKIFPVFYDVEPLDVKLETELYNSALNKLEERYGGTRVDAWKEALKTVGRFRGWPLKDQIQGHGKAMTEITQKVLQRIAIRKRDLPSVLVGIDDRVEDIKKLLNCLDTSDVRFVIIHGMSGIGKTTLAEAVINQLSLEFEFEAHSFLSNSRGSSPSDSILKMQRKLVADLFGYQLPETFNFQEGNNFIRNRLPNKRVLLVFDGMDDIDQFMKLAKHCTSYGPGSRIIITTQDKGVFSKTKMEGLEKKILMGSTKVFEYEMKEMDLDHALLLFNKLAFNTDSAPHDLYKLSREVVKLMGGLPLAVEAIGSHVGSQSREERESTLQGLKEKPPEKVLQLLQISYDALNDRAQQIFLDIACFFANRKKSDPMYMWKDYGLDPENTLKLLIKKHLIKIIDDDRIWMHEQYRALGREIVCLENMKSPEHRSRLFLLEADPKMGTEVALALPRRSWGHYFTCIDFANLTNARLLILDGGNFAGNFEKVSLDVRLLYWRNCPPKVEATNFLLSRLIVLKLSGDNINTRDWSGWVEIMVASRLKVLKIAGSKSLTRTPCFSEFKSLERLVLKDFPSLAHIGPSIGRLERLIYLKIKWCPRLRELPEQIGCLTALRELILIQGFSVRYLPESIGNLGRLSSLVMEDMGLVQLPETIKRLGALEYFYLANCTGLQSLPNAIGELRSLKELDLSGTTIKTLPRSVYNLEDLTLRMYSSEIRTRLMTDLRLLELVIEDCKYPTRFQDIAESENTLKNLNEVSVKKIRQTLNFRYEALKYGAKNTFLDIAVFSDNKKNDRGNAIGLFREDEIDGLALDLFREDEIDVLVNESLIKIVDHTRIWMHDLTRDFGRKIAREENIGKSEYQSRLWFSNLVLDRVPTGEGIQNVVGLTLWRLRDNFKGEDFANLKNARSFELDRGYFPGKQANIEFNHLNVLKLSGDITTEEWSTWVKIMVASKLKVLKITGSKFSTTTPCFSESMSLERLTLKDFPSLAEIDRSIGKLKRLIYLKIKCCPLLGGLPQEIGCLTALRELALIQVCSARYLSDSIGNLRRLSTLIIEDPTLVELPDTIKGPKNVEHLHLANCKCLSSLPDAVGELKSLTHLVIYGTSIEGLPPSLWNLEALNLWIKGSNIEAQLMRYRPLLRDLEDSWDLKELQRYIPFKRATSSVIPLRSYPMDILCPEWRTIVVPGFHEHHLSGRCPPKILARIIFPHGNDFQINVDAEVPLWDTMIMSSSQPYLYFRSLILMLVSWLERKWISKWIIDFQRKDKELLSLEFCDRCMSITSEIREFNDSPLSESFHRFSPLSTTISLTLYEPGRRDRFGCKVENMEILSNFSSPILRSTNLLLKCPWSTEKLGSYIEFWNSSHEKATQVRGSMSRKNLKNRMSRRLRKKCGGRLQANKRLNLTWLCLRNYLDERLLRLMIIVCAIYSFLSLFIETKLDYYGYVLEEARLLLDSAIDVRQKTRLAREFTRFCNWLDFFIDIEKIVEGDHSELWEDTLQDWATLLLNWYRRHGRRGGHHQ